MEAMEMVYRAMAVADIEPIGRFDRSADPDLCRTHRGLHAFALGKARRDRRVQRASGAVGVLGGDAWRRQSDGAAAVEQIIDALAALPVAALDQDRATSHRKQPRALACDGCLAGRNRLIEQRGGFRQVWRDQRGAWNQFAAQTRDR